MKCLPQRARQAGAFLVILALVAAVAPALAAPSTSQSPRIDINVATVETLTGLPGIGPAIAQRIVEYRQQNGPFKRPVELMNVKGIGEKTFDRLRDRIRVGKSAAK